MTPRVLSLFSLLASFHFIRARDASVPTIKTAPLSFAVLGSNGAFRNGSDIWNPQNVTPPFFQVFDDEFYNILGAGNDLEFLSISNDDTFAFAHEAPVWIPETDEVWFTSNAGGALGRSGLDANNQVGKISLKEVDDALEAGGDVNVTHYKVDLPDTVQMTNGGTGPYKGKIIFMNQGRGSLPANMVLVDPKDPSNVTVMLDNYYGRQFISLNDVKVHPSGEIFFTDVPYGFYQHFKPEPQIAIQVYRFNPQTGAVRVATDLINKPNGLTFSPDYKFAYVADTGVFSFTSNATLPATIYKYDVEEGTLAFSNRRTFAYADTGAADGLGVDENGYVYAGCGDGVHVWNPSGVLLGKFFVGSSTANFAFAGQGKLVILAETDIYLVKGLNVKGQDLEVVKA